MSSSKLTNDTPPNIPDGGCPICLMELDETNQSVTDKVISLCKVANHKFHAVCIDTWVRIHGNCPLCRFPITVLSNGAPIPYLEHARANPVVVPGGGNPFVQRVRGAPNFGADENNYHRHTAAFIGHRIQVARRRASLSESPQLNGMQRINELNTGRQVMPSPASAGPSPAPREGSSQGLLPPLLELSNMSLDAAVNMGGTLNHMNLDDANETVFVQPNSGNYRGIFERQHLNDS